MKVNRLTSVVACALACLALAASAFAGVQPLDRSAVERLGRETGGQVSLHRATGAVRFVRPAPGGVLAPAGSGSLEANAMAFFERHAAAFGMSAPRTQLRFGAITPDAAGGSHIAFQQYHAGVPVFAGVMRARFDKNGALTAVNGTFVPVAGVATTPAVSQNAAAASAIAAVRKTPAGDHGAVDASGLLNLGTRLIVFRTNLARGTVGASRLAWEIKVGNLANIGEHVYVDAVNGAVLDRISYVHDATTAMFRIAYDTAANYPGTPYWTEGDAFPTPSAEANNTIGPAADIYNLHENGFGRNSYDGAGATMHTVFNRNTGCPNASWNGTYTSYCPGVTGDDIVGHEWQHAYTQYTHGLIYQWQPGALNEAYSDIYGETADILNGTGLDTPGGPRTVGNCTDYTPPFPLVRVNSPANIAQDFNSGSCVFCPPLTQTGVTGNVVLVDDGVGTGVPPAPAATDGCTAIVNNIAGMIALIDRGSCTFKTKVANAQLAGAIGVIIANHVTGGEALINMADDPAVTTTITIPASFIGYSRGNIVKSELANTVNASIKLSGGLATDDSYRWLVGEDSPSFGGAIRDMYTPQCYRNPGRVGDLLEYHCATSDNGGVHGNSGVPNHAYALLVDGGTYNGQTITGIGFTRAAAIYFRAMVTYQVPTTDFADHADAVELSCTDLIGLPLNDLVTGLPSIDVITPTDCQQVIAAMIATEMRDEPVQCGFIPILAPNAPLACGGGATTDLFADDFEAGLGNWTVSNFGPWTPRDWAASATLPDGRAGTAAYASDPSIGDCGPDDQTGAMAMDSPSITVPAADDDVRVRFMHYISTEPAYDGGNVKINVNGAGYQVIAAADFAFNPYNSTLLATNPLAGEPGFSGTDPGTLGGSWGESQINLANYVAPGDQFTLRFQFGADGCGGNDGWYVDDLFVYICGSTCAGETVPPAVTAPAALTAQSSVCVSNSPVATSGTNAALATWLGSATATDACDATPTALAPQVGGVDVTATTAFPIGVTTVTFRYQDDAGNIGSSTADVTVRLYHGDLDDNELLDASDLVTLANSLVGNVSSGTPPFNAPLDAADVDNDGDVDAADLVLLANRLVSNVACLPTT